MSWLEVSIETSHKGVEAVAACLTAQGYDSLVIDDQQQYEGFLEENREYWDYIDESLAQSLQGLSRIRLYLEADGTQEAQLETIRTQLAALKQRLPSDPGSLTVTAQPLPETDWENSWKDNYPPQEVGRSLVVLPYWLAEDYDGGRLPVILDPGLTFGTGAHPSTQMCMEALEERLQPGARVIDLGSGSGILSLTALRLGAGSAVGVDVDPKAEDIARENAAYNGFAAPAFTALTGNVSDQTGPMARLAEGGYDVVLVNIVADVIIALAPELPRFLKPDSLVILSGILDVRLPDVLEAITAAGLRVVEQKAKEDWRCLVAALA